MDPGQVSHAHRVQELEVIGIIPPSLWGREANSQRKGVIASLMDTQKNQLEAVICPMFLFLTLLSLSNQKSPKTKSHVSLGVY